MKVEEIRTVLSSLQSLEASDWSTHIAGHRSVALATVANAMSTLR